MIAGLFRTRPAVTAGRSLYAAAVAQARLPAFYAGQGVADTAMGRFELYTLHVSLLARRLKGLGEEAKEVGQALINAYFDELDIALREIGVGDLSMSKKMKKLGQAFYGRLTTLENALAGAEPLDDFLRRTIFEGDEHAAAGPMAAYVTAADRLLSEQENSALLAGRVEWPGAPA